MRRDQDRFNSRELRYNSDTSTGYLLQPRFYLSVTDAGGQAERIDLLGPQQMDIRQLRYSSCKVGDDETPPWLLTASRLRLDIAANEGIADDAVLRFYDVPILALPRLSFPVTDERKSGWLPPTIDLSTTSGLVVATPYYWNIAPQYDATFTPVLSVRRGAELDSEFRYLQPGWRGETALAWLPRDEVAGTTRWASRWSQRGEAPLDADYKIDLLRVSDGNYWSDGLRGADNLTPRLLGSNATLRQLRREHWDGLGWVDRRSEERRVGKECRRLCRSRWSPYH
jgi:LPS-assembly protein